MKCRIPVALALAGGYVLGRTKKMKLALAVAGIAAGSGLPINPGELAKRGAGALQSSEEVGKLVELARTGLVDAGKAAAVSVASSRIESLSERLSDRTAKLGAPAKLGASGDEDEAADEEAVEEDEPVTDEAEDEEEPAEEEAEPVAKKKAPARKSTNRRSSGRSGGGRRTTRTRRGADNG
jgi:hypothetical protein